MSTLILQPATRPARPVRPAARSAVRPAARPSGTVRLTRRGRLVVFVLALLIVLGTGIALAAGSVASQEPGTPEPTQVIVVRSGQTLWDIAAAHAQDGDVRGMLTHLQHLNALDGGMVRAGQRLQVPLD